MNGITAAAALLYIHVALGIINLATGIAVVILKKGGTIHRRLGMVFFWTMMGVAGSAIVLTVLHPNNFLAVIGVFSGYLAFTGNLMVRKRIRKYRAAMWAAMALALPAAGYMIYTQNLVLIIFGGILLFLLIGDFRLMRLPEIPGMKLIRTHATKMMAALMASTTAFLVNVVSFEPAFVLWILPTAIGTPLLIFMTRNYITRKAVNPNKS